MGRERDGANGVAVALEEQLSVVRVVLDAGDLHAAERGAEAGDDRLAQIVGERPRPLHVVHVHDDRFRFGLADPDRQQTRARLLLEDDDVRFRSRVDPQLRHYDFNHLDTRHDRIARASLAARSVRSQVNSVIDDRPWPTFFGERPKCP